MISYDKYGTIRLLEMEKNTWYNVTYEKQRSLIRWWSGEDEEEKGTSMFIDTHTDTANANS